MSEPKSSDDNKVARDFTQDREEHPRVADWREDGLWIIIMSMGGRNFCVYVGIPVDHPLACHDYENLPIDCHGGLTYGGAGDGEYRPEGHYWYGWDYGHYGDYTWWGHESHRGNQFNEKDWTLGEVKNDIWSAIYDFGKLKRLSEKIYTEARR